MFNNTQIIIMAGGVGSRFWPMSTPDYPKQFIDVMGVGRSLIQLTVDRLKPICPVDNMWVVTNEKYIRIVKEQIPDMPVDNILAEPEARNTAPCIAYACWKIQKKHPDANIVVTPSDALVINTSEYQRVLSKALSYTFDKNAIVTIGIKPSRPETGYGYIAAAEPTSVDEIYKVEAFKEKPNLETAEQYLAAGNYYWNAGIFVWNIDTISKAIRTFQPQLASIMDEMAPSFYTEQEKEVVGKLFPTCEKISIDYAVMEKSQHDAEAELRTSYEQLQGLQEVIDHSDVKLLQESLALFKKALQQGEITALVYYVEINSIYEKLQRHIDLHCQSVKLLAELHRNEL